MPASLFAKVYIDIMHMPIANQYRYIVAAKDDLSGTSEAQPLKNATAQNLAKFFWEYIYCRYGAPLLVITDNGPEVKEAFDILLKRLQIPQVRITPYNHDTNGVVERGHFIIREALVKTCKERLVDWPDRLAEIMFADQITTNRSTGFSPYQLLHATNPILPLDIAEATFLVEEFQSGISSEKLLELRARQIAKHPEDVARAAETLWKSRFASKKQFERRFIKRLSKKLHEPGDLVLMRNTKIEMSHDRKALQRYLGPYVVGERTEKDNYRLLELDGTKIRGLGAVANFRVLPYISRHHWFMQIITPPPPMKKTMMKMTKKTNQRTHTQTLKANQKSLISLIKTRTTIRGQYVSHAQALYTHASDRTITLISFFQNERKCLPLSLLNPCNSNLHS
jgi:hypothetical protein